MSRRKRRIRQGNDPDYLAWIRTLECAVAGKTKPGGLLDPCDGITESSHNVSKNLSGDDRKTIPLCTGHHRTNKVSWHKGKTTFQRLAGIDAEALAKTYSARYDGRGEDGLPF